MLDLACPSARILKSKFWLKLLKHSWYLTEENGVFALFSCSAAVSNETKQKIAD